MLLEENYEKHCKNTFLTNLKWNQVLPSLLQTGLQVHERAEESAITDELLLNFI